MNFIKKLTANPAFNTFNVVANGLLLAVFAYWLWTLGHAEGTLLLMAAPMRTSDLRAVVEPIINDVFKGLYNKRVKEYSLVFDEKEGIKREYHEEPVLYAFGAAPEIAEGEPVTYQSGGVLYQQRYLYKRYGLAFALTSTLVDDSAHLDAAATFGAHLERSLSETIELVPANVINRAYNSAYPGGDGVSLGNASHPIVGGTFSNILATPAALSQTSLEQALIMVDQAVTNNGLKAGLKARRIVAGPTNRLQAEVVSKSVLRSGTSVNDLNPIKSLNLLPEDPAILTRLTSTTAWGILTDADRGFQVLWRRRMSGSASMEGDFETDSMRFKRIIRFASGYTDARCFFSTPGA